MSTNGKSHGAALDTTPDKPCCKRIDHADVSRFETSIVWCTRGEGHDGECRGPEPTIIERTPLRGRR